MTTTVNLSSLLAATLASAAFALGLDWLLLCAAFQAMSRALSRAHSRRALADSRRMQASLSGCAALRRPEQFR
jgi:hypothetical protein